MPDGGVRCRRAWPLRQPLAIVVAVIGEPLDVVSDLGLERRRDHPTSLPSELIKRERDLGVPGPGACDNSVRSFPPHTAVGALNRGTYTAFLVKPIHNTGV